MTCLLSSRSDRTYLERMLLSRRRGTGISAERQALPFELFVELPPEFLLFFGYRTVPASAKLGDEPFADLHFLRRDGLIQPLLHRVDPLLRVLGHQSLLSHAEENDTTTHIVRHRPLPNIPVHPRTDSNPRNCHQLPINQRLSSWHTPCPSGRPWIASWTPVTDIAAWDAGRLGVWAVPRSSSRSWCCCRDGYALRWREQRSARDAWIGVPSRASSRRPAS